MPEISDIELSTLKPEEVSLAAGVAARGMRDNPSSIALFGRDPARRERALEPTYHWILSSSKRPCLVAKRDGRIVGLAALAPPDQCFFRQIASRQKTVRIGQMRLGIAVPSVPWHLLFPLLRLGFGALGRLSTWGEVGMQHDPDERHQHIELVVVDADLQGQGIGGKMMDELCREIDELPDVSYLETDKPENVRFYERFGFKVSGESTVLETRVWYMERRH